jgi:hypothetical protein
MSISGLAEKTLRYVNNKIRGIFKSITGVFRKAPEEEADEIPQKWVRAQKIKPEKASSGQFKVKGGKILMIPTRKPHTLGGRVYHWPWLRNFKRGMAALCLLLNFVISQYLLAAAGLQWMALFFFANSFVMIDYLWKTRRESS